MSQTNALRHLDKNHDYTATAIRLFDFQAEDSDFHIVQGGCIVGDSFRVAMIHRDETGYETVRIITLGMDGKLLHQSEILPLDHANNLTYNKNRNAIISTHCQAPNGNHDKYSMLDADTYEILASGNTGTPFFSMAYSSERNKYASGQWGGETLNTWSSDLKVEKTVPVEPPKTLSQGVFCDGDFIYFVRSSQNGVSAEIRVYDWELTLIRTIPLTLEGTIEPESINIKDGITYVIGNDFNTGHGVCFSLTYHTEE